MLRSRRPTRPPQRPGWYPDGSGWLRYFDGQGWTELVRERLVLADFRPQPPVAERPPRQASTSRPRQGVRIASIVLACVLLGGVVLQLVALTLSPQGASASSLSGRAALALARQACEESPVSESAVLASERVARAAAATRAARLTQLASEARTDVLDDLAAAWSNVAVAMVQAAPRSSSLREAIASVDTAASGARLPACRA